MTVKWAKTEAINRMNSNGLLQEILQIEPGLRPILEEAQTQRNIKGYNRIRRYIELRNKAGHLVGTLADNQQLRNSKSYDVVIKTIDDLLPPDNIDVQGD
ncbi:MAG: hypothetical protein KJ077_07705 [Anaerolineae bacterium]|nr:hypothetical protein [Anaerolineae bacterium]